MTGKTRNYLMAGLCGSIIAMVAACGPASNQGDGCAQHAECDDGNPCTDDICSISGICEWVANSAPCDDADSCTDGDRCLDGVCSAGTNVCPCADNSDCSAFEDGDLCNGTLVCADGMGCTIDPTTVVTCATDGDTECTKNRCSPTTAQCQLTPLPAGTACDDGDDCTGADACSQGSCRGGTETCCDDGVDNDGDANTDCDDPACNALPVCESSCPTVLSVEDSPLPIESSTSLIESTTANGFADDYVYNQAGTIKLGTRRNWGGSIVFFGLANGAPGLNTTNAIDSADTGREVQIALYDVDRWYQNCAWNASCNATPSPTMCPQQMTWLGWNPVQGGNRCNNGSGVDAVSTAAGAVEVTTRPLFWNPHWDRTDCDSNACGNPAVNMRRSDIEVTQRVRFVRPNIVELSYTLTNLVALDHAVSTHEFPTVYTSFGRNGTPDLHRLFDSTQTPVAINEYPPNDESFRYKNFTSPHGWVAFQNDNQDYGVGILYENGLDWFQAWQADDPDFNNVRGLFAFAIPPFGQVRARSYLILGSLATVAAEAQWLKTHLPPFGSLDAPVVDAEVSGLVSVHGWAMDNQGVSAVQLIIDGGPPIPLTYGTHRPDVCLVWPGYPACASDNVGYSGSFDASALAPGECGHVLEINAIDTHGNARVIARRRIYRAP